MERDRLLEDYLAAWNGRDAERISSFFSADAVYEDHGAGVTARGNEEIRAHAARVHSAFPDLRFELIRVAHGEDFTAAEWRSEMTHDGSFEGLAATGRRVASAGVDVATLDSDSRIVRLDSYYDGAAIMRALGLLPGRGSRFERLLVRGSSLLGKLPGRT